MTDTDRDGGGPVCISRPAELLAVREARGWSRLDVARQIKFQVRQIAALENGRYDELPGRAFVRGALRSYGNLLEVDVTPLLSSIGGHAEPAVLTVPLRHSVAARLSEMEAEFEPAVTQNRHTSMAWGVGGVAVVLALLAYFGAPASLEQAERWLGGGSDAATETTAQQAAAGGRGLMVEDPNWAEPLGVWAGEVPTTGAVTLPLTNDGMGARLGTAPPTTPAPATAPGVKPAAAVSATKPAAASR